VYSDASQLVAPIWRKTARKVWRVEEKLRGMIEESGDLYYNLVEYSAGELRERAVFLRSNTHYDVVLIEFGSTLHGGPHEATPDATRRYHESLIATEQRLAKSKLPYHAFVSAHNKNARTGLTQHTMCRAEKSVYYAGDVGISLSQWVADAVNGECRSLGVDGLL
jgi:hypothetical protein